MTATRYIPIESQLLRSEVQNCEHSVEYCCRKQEKRVAGKHVFVKVNIFQKCQKVKLLNIAPPSPPPLRVGDQGPRFRRETLDQISRSKGISDFIAKNKHTVTSLGIVHKLRIQIWRFYDLPSPLGETFLDPLHLVQVSRIFSQNNSIPSWLRKTFLESVSLLQIRFFAFALP